MKLSYTVLLVLQSLMVSATPVASPEEIVKSPAQLIKERLAGDPIEKRACNYGGCDGCLGRFSYCVQCNGANGSPSSCVNCWVFCAANCGC